MDYKTLFADTDIDIKISSSDEKKEETPEVAPEEAAPQEPPAPEEITPEGPAPADVTSEAAEQLKAEFDILTKEYVSRHIATSYLCKFGIDDAFRSLQTSSMRNHFNLGMENYSASSKMSQQVFKDLVYSMEGLGSGLKRLWVKFKNWCSSAITSTKVKLKSLGTAIKKGTIKVTSSMIKGAQWCRAQLNKALAKLLKVLKPVPKRVIDKAVKATNISAGTESWDNSMVSMESNEPVFGKGFKLTTIERTVISVLSIAKTIGGIVEANAVLQAAGASMPLSGMIVGSLVSFVGIFLGTYICYILIRALVHVVIWVFFGGSDYKGNTRAAAEAMQYAQETAGNTYQYQQQNINW